MNLYFKIENAGTTNDAIIEEIYLDDGAMYSDIEASLLNGKPFLTPVAIIRPPFDTETQIEEGPFDAWDGVNALREYIVRDKTQQEIDDEQMISDIDALQNSAGKDIALVVCELTQWILDNTAMTPADFPQSVIDAFQRVKVIADRVK